MKKWLIALFVINLLTFAVLQWGGELLQDGSKIQAAPALHNEQIHIVSAPVANVALPATPASVSSANLLCMEWSDFSGSDLTRANDALTPLKLGNKLSSRPIEYSSGFWVYLPPLKDKAAITKKLEQLKARGVSEYFVVAEAGEWQHAISLGVFKSEESAQNYLTILKDRGVNSAKVGERASKLKATIFVFKQVDEALVEQLKTLQKEFPSSELKSVECR
jgi:hypothetical protein